MTPEFFINKWRTSTLKERSASQSHFNDLCTLLEVENPTDADPKGEWYCFERGASKTAGGEGWADVWKRGHFGWEYKGKRKDLTAAFAQLQQYAVALENPPLLVVSDMERIVIHTNWTNTVSEVHSITLDELRDSKKRDLLRAVFSDPERLKPKKTIDALTREVADKFAGLAIRLRDEGHDPQAVAHFVNRIVFCMFAEDINFLPHRLFSQILDKAKNKPEIATALLRQLFAAMRSGGLFGTDEIEWFNGGLFDDDSALTLNRADIKAIAEAAEFDWSDIDPSIFGTLFERGLDPAKRSQLGAHYTDPEKIMMVIRPVIIEPLWRDWEAIKTQITKPRTSEKKRRELLAAFLERLRGFRILDPACGSGNFLYLALLSLKDIEHRVNLEAEALGLGRQFPTVGPEVVQGIELNLYAAELARVTIWIGEIQWMRKNGFDVSRRPILKPLKNIEHRDALLNEDGTEAKWPKANAIIGNPPFLTARKMQPELGADYVAKLRKAYNKRLPDGADFVCFWFLKALAAVKENARAGLLATKSISDSNSRPVVADVISESHLFRAWADEPWTVDGAAVRVAILCFAPKNAEPTTLLEEKPVLEIYPDLTGRTADTGVDLTKAARLPSNKNVAFQGVVPRSNLNPKSAAKFKLPKASFMLDGTAAREMLAATGNPNGRPNSDVIKRFLIGDDLTSGTLDRFIVDFSDMTEAQACLYEKPFAHIEPVKAHRAKMNQPQALLYWWRHWNTRPKMRAALKGLSRFIITPETSKYRLFAWCEITCLPDHKLYAIAREDDVSFGILHSRFHELWSLAKCSWHGAGNDPRYTPSTTFETFPFPNGLEPNLKPADYANPDATRIAAAAKQLSELRENWLHPAELVKRVPEVVAGYPDRILPAGIAAKHELKKRTLTNLYNARPAWLVNAHAELDAAVASAYGWPSALTDDEVLKHLLALSLKRCPA